MLLACQPTHHTLPPALITPPPRSGRRPCDVADFSIHALGALDPTKLQSSLPGDSAPAQHPTRHHSSAQSPLEALSPAGPPPRSGTRPCDVDCLSHDASLRLATLPCMLHNAQSILTLPSRKKTSAKHLHHQYDITAQPKSLTPFGKESL